MTTNIIALVHYGLALSVLFVLLLTGTGDATTEEALLYALLGVGTGATTALVVPTVTAKLAKPVPPQTGV